LAAAGCGNFFLKLVCFWYEVSFFYREQFGLYQAFSLRSLRLRVEIFLKDIKFNGGTIRYI